MEIGGKGATCSPFGNDGQINLKSFWMLKSHSRMIQKKPQEVHSKCNIVGFLF